MSILTYKVTHLPDLEKTEYHARYGDNPASQLFKMQDKFLYTLHTIANQYSLSCSVIYDYNPDEEDQDKKLQIFVRVKFNTTLAPQDFAQIKTIFQSSFWYDFYKIKEVEAHQINFDWCNYISFGIKQEQSLSPTVTREQSLSHYYLIDPFKPNEETNKVSFCSKLEAYDKRALIEVVIEPTILTETETSGLEKLLRRLGELTSYDSKTSPATGKVYEQPVDPVAERALKLFEDLRKAIQSQPLYEISIRVLAENKFNASLLLNEFWLESSEKPLYREIGIDSTDSRFRSALESVKLGRIFPQAIWTEYWNNISDNSSLRILQRLHRLFTVEEACACFRVVVPDPVVIFSGIPKETDLNSSSSNQSILLGWQSGKPKNQAQIPLQSLNKHIFVCGVPGSGKTSAIINLLFQLWTEHNISFLVIEPAKTEYRAMLSCTYNETALDQDENVTTQAYIKARYVPKVIAKMQRDLQIFSLGNERVCPFRFNPFVFYGKTTLDEHISTLEACFRAAMPLFGPLPALLAEALEQIYAQFDWQPQDVAEDGLKQGREFPNMQELYEAITEILKTKQYSSDVMGDIKTALEVRIGGLLRRSVGSMLNTRISEPSIESLMTKPIILEMDSLNEEQANLMTMFILASLRQYARITRKSGSDLKHVVIIEEAHNIVGTDANGHTEEGIANPKAEATKYIVRMLAEMRALGEGIIIADQLPSAVSPEVIKNTNVKLAHRTVSGDDREILEQCMLLTGTQSEELARSMPGDAYLFMEGIYKPVRIKEPDTKLIYGITEPPSDEELVVCIQDQDFYRNAIATQTSLQQQKVNHNIEVVLAKLSNLYESSLFLFNKNEWLLSFSLKDDIEDLDSFIQSLQELAPQLNERLESTKTEISNIKIATCIQGVYHDLMAHTAIQETQEQLSQCLRELEQVYILCLDTIEEVKQEVIEVANGLYNQGIEILSSGYQGLREEITNKQREWENISMVASIFDIDSLKVFCAKVEENLTKLETSVDQSLNRSKAHQFVSQKVKVEYSQYHQFGNELRQFLKNLTDNVSSFEIARNNLKEAFLQIEKYFNDYEQQANCIIDLINQNIAQNEIKNAYEKLVNLREAIYSFVDAYDLETEQVQQLAYVFDPKIESMIKEIAKQEAMIERTYKAKY